MNAVIFGLIAGLAFGLVDVLLMLPLPFADKRTALIAAFCSRFAIGFLVPQCQLPIPRVAIGALVGLLISLPDALITKAYLPILVGGVVGGSLLGWLAGRFVA